MFKQEKVPSEFQLLKFMIISDQNPWIFMIFDTWLIIGILVGYLKDLYESIIIMDRSCHKGFEHCWFIMAPY